MALFSRQFIGAGVPIFFAAAMIGFTAGPARAASSGIGTPGTIVPPDVVGIRDIGALPPNVPLRVGFVLANQHAAELDADVALVSERGSPHYRHFLSNAQWNAYFAPSNDTVRSVSAALVRAGFQIEGVTANRGMLTAAAPAATLERFFSTRFRSVRELGTQGVRYRNATPATIPSALRAGVTAVTGLDDIAIFRPHPLARHAALAAPSPGINRYAKIGGRIVGPDGGYGPIVLANGYDYPVQHGYNGAGGTVGFGFADDYIASDTATFLSYFGIKETGKVTRVPVDGGYTAAPYGFAAIDVEAIASLAPGVNIEAYEFPEFDTRSILDTYNQVVSDNTVDVFTDSWAFCEIGVPQSALDAEKVIFEQGALKGITFVVASNDFGAYSCDPPDTSPAVSADSSNPYVTTVGGVHVDIDTATGAITSTTATWLDTIGSSAGAEGSGGGVSTEWPLPSYQKNVAVSKAGRNVPDLALVGDAEFSFYFQGTWQGPQGGTEWAAPAFNAMLEETNEFIGHENDEPISRAGFVNPALYAAYGSVGSRVFTDVTTGNNGLPGVGPGYNAGPGYDLVTGLGTPIGMGLADFL